MALVDYRRMMLGVRREVVGVVARLPSYAFSATAAQAGDALPALIFVAVYLDQGSQEIEWGD